MSERPAFLLPGGERSDDPDALLEAARTAAVREALEEAGLAVDEPGFRSLMAEQRERDEAAILARLKAGETSMSVYGWGI